jgi:thiamine biosynthesis lipoprotein
MAPPREPEPHAPVRHHAAHHAMGTLFSITAYAATSTCVEQAVALAFQEIDRLESILSHYKPASELSTINREACHRNVTLTPQVFDLLQQSLQLSADTSGAFDITLGRLMKAWGFFENTELLPTPAELQHLLPTTGHKHVLLDTPTQSIRFDRPAIELDLGAIGKGYAVDRVVQLLRDQKIHSALISAGTSTIYALGAPPGTQSWQVSLCHPLDRRKQACTLHLRDLAVSISGTHERSFVLDGKLYTHILNPEDGQPAHHTLMSAAVTPSSTTSDALSTAFFVGGPALARTYLATHRETAAILYLRDQPPAKFDELILHSTLDPLSRERLLHAHA